MKCTMFLSSSNISFLLGGKNISSSSTPVIWFVYECVIKILLASHYEDVQYTIYYLGLQGSVNSIDKYINKNISFM